MTEITVDSIQSANLKLLESEDLFDVTFLIGPAKEQVKAHKLILSSRSPVFKAMFNSVWDGENKNAEVEIPDTDVDTFRSFLKFLYADKMGGGEIPEIMNLLYLGDKYDVQVLLTKCDDYLFSKIDQTNYLELHQAAKVCARKDLMTRIEKNIAWRFTPFSKSIDFKNIDEELLRSLLRRDDLNIDEVDVLDAVIRWGQDRLDLSAGSSLNEKPPLLVALKHVLPLVRFPTMTLHQFASVVRPLQLISDGDMLDIFTYLASTGDHKKELGRNLKYSTFPRRRVVLLDEQRQQIGNPLDEALPPPAPRRVPPQRPRVVDRNRRVNRALREHIHIDFNDL